MPLFVGEDSFVGDGRRTVDLFAGLAFTGDNVVCTICFFPDVIGGVGGLVGDDNGVVGADPSVWLGGGLDSSLVCTISFRRVVDGLFTDGIRCTFVDRFWSPNFGLCGCTSESATLVLFSGFVLPRFAIVDATFNEFVSEFGSTVDEGGRHTMGALTFFGTED